MTPDGLLSLLLSRGIHLSLDGSSIKYCAPAGAMTPELFAELGKLKSELLVLLRTSSPRSLPVWPATLQHNPGVETENYVPNVVSDAAGRAFTVAGPRNAPETVSQGIAGAKEGVVSLTPAHPRLFKDLPGLRDTEVLRRLNNPKTPHREWHSYADAAAARGLVGHPAPAHAGGFRPHPFASCSPENPAPGHRLWRSVHGVLVCGSCHAPAVPGLVAEWLPVKYAGTETESDNNTAPADQEDRHSSSTAGDPQGHKSLTRGPAGEQKGTV